MRRSTSIASRITVTLLSVGLLSTAAVLVPSAAQADDSGSISRGSIADDSTRAAAASYRQQNAQQRDSVRAADRVRAEVVRTALKQVGDSYGSGGDGPNVFDCSGLTLYAWRTAGVKLTHYSYAQYKQTQRISLKDARPGDLAFYFRNGAHHVALYIGDGKVVHASDYGIGVVKGVVKGTPWTNEHFTGMGRVKIPGLS